MEEAAHSDRGGVLTGSESVVTRKVLSVTLAGCSARSFCVRSGESS